MALLTCCEAEFSYDGHIAVRGLNFEISSGDYLVVVGKNGSGKSTLIKGMLNLKQPSRGSVSFGDGLKSNEIGYLPQQTPVQKDFPASVREVVLSGRLNRLGLRPFYSRNDHRAAAQNMESLGVSDLRHKCYRELSGGQQQRVLLARALCATKKLLLLDEPGAGLDPVVSAELYTLIDRLNKDTGLSIVMVSHDVDTAIDHGSLVLHLEGQQVFFGTTADYRKSAAGIQFLGGEENA